MAEYHEILDGLEQVGLGAWRVPLEAMLRDRFADSAHGDLDSWRTAVNELPAIRDAVTDLDARAVTVNSRSIDEDRERQIRDALMRLRPWRKGPFHICGVELDAEWRSDLKWDRLAGAITPLDDRQVLDVGCGNGYYAYRMTGAGARLVVGIDPTLLYVMQFHALNRLFDVRSILVLPLRLRELPQPDNRFDTTFSMGVLYHQRDPAQHLAELRATLRRGGELVLESLVLPGNGVSVHEPEGRYARMRNVWHLPTVPALEAWLRDAGFRDLRLIDVTQTTLNEQRTTEWMPFESLAEALDPDDTDRTIEGLPAPARALLVCKAP